MKPFRCPACDEGEVVPMRRPGTRLPHKTIPNLELPESIALPTCNSCGEEWWDAETTKAVHEALEAAYLEMLSRRADEAIGRLARTVAQRDLEQVLGLSAGYLSKLKGGKLPSAPLVATLMLLANSPRRIDELRQLWEKEPGLPLVQVVQQRQPVVFWSHLQQEFPSEMSSPRPHQRSEFASVEPREIAA